LPAIIGRVQSQNLQLIFVQNDQEIEAEKIIFHQSLRLQWLHEDHRPIGYLQNLHLRLSEPGLLARKVRASTSRRQASRLLPIHRAPRCLVS
jgi:hypothetical protein